MTTPTALRILVCGHRSFAARGLVEALNARGHDAVGFTRGAVGRDGGTVTGPVDRIADNPHLDGPIDAVVNYILLKDESRQRNNDYLASLLELCRRRGVKHLVHISSISSYRADVRLVTEDAPAETDPDKKGSYGSLKVATDQFLLTHTPAELALSFLRPGFILGPGVADPIVGMGVRLPYNRILLLGAAHNCVPVTTRELVNEAVVRVVERRPDAARRVFLLADTNSPTRKQWLQGCCEALGAGLGLVSFPVPLWLLAGVGGEAVARVLRMGIKPYKIIRGMCRAQRFDARATARALDLDLSVDWRRELVASLDGQSPDWTAPHRPVRAPRCAARSVVFLGFGGIVRQKHLPALRALGFRGSIEAYDLRAGEDAATGQRVRPIEEASLPAADLYIIASPGPVHNRAIPLLDGREGPVLVEKPLCYTAEELDEWLRFERSRRGPVLVLHNYRFKANVSAMLAHLQRYNPGRLHHVDVHFQSPSVSKDVPWRRDERRARTLLMDYALHFLDLACMFNSGPWNPTAVRHEINNAGQTSLIEGRLASDTYGVSFLLRQGFMPRKTRIFYTFENYGVGLSFFPDTFVPHMTFDGWGLHKAEARANFRGTVRKVADKLTGRDADVSHALAIAGACGEPTLAPSMSLARLEAFYRAVFRIADHVYGPATTGARA